MIKQTQPSTPSPISSSVCNNEAARSRGDMDEYYASLLQQLYEHPTLSDKTSRSIGLTSSARRSGVTTVATNLAIHAANVLQQGVLLVDTNVAHPSMHRIFRTNGAPGVVEALSGKVNPLDCIQTSSIDNLSLLTTGATSARAWDIYESEAMATFFRVIHESFGIIIFDLPAADRLSHCYSLVSKLDGIALVVEAEKDKTEVSQWAAQRLQQAGANLLGVVFNKCRHHIPGWLYRTL